MIGVLKAILCVLQNIILVILGAGIYCLNLVIEGLAQLLGAVVTLMPAMPALPTLPSPLDEVVPWIAWFFPVGTVVAILGFLLVAWLSWQVVAIGLRWAKAL